MDGDWDPFADPAEGNAALAVDALLRVKVSIGHEAPGKEEDTLGVWGSGGLLLEEDEEGEVAEPLNPWEDSVFVDQAREAARREAEAAAAAREAAAEREARRLQEQRAAAEARAAAARARRAAREAAELEAAREAAEQEDLARNPARLKEKERKAFVKEVAYRRVLDAISAAPKEVARRLEEEQEAQLKELYEREASGAASSSSALSVPSDPDQEASFRETAARTIACSMGIKINFGSKGAAADSPPSGLLFPDQSSRSLRLLSGSRNLPAVRAMLEKAELLLGFDVLEPATKTDLFELFRGPEAIPVWLEETRYCQPAMYVSAMAGIEALKKRKPTCLARLQGVSGLSLGEYAALTHAGVFDFDTALQLVALRGEFMHEAAELSRQRMLSVAGLDRATVERLCREAVVDSISEQQEEEDDPVCQIAQSLFQDGFLCSGSEAAVERLLEKARATVGCKQVRLMKREGSGGFHTDLMDLAREKLHAALLEVEHKMKPPRCNVYMGARAKRVDAKTRPSEIIEMLCEALTDCFRWEDCVRQMLDDGIRQFYECGPMQQLQGMMRRIDAGAAASMVSVDHIQRNEKEKPKMSSVYNPFRPAAPSAPVMLVPFVQPDPS